MLILTCVSKIVFGKLNEIYTRMSKATNKLYITAFLLAAVLGQTFFEKEIILDASSSYHYLHSSDSFQLGGKSESTLQINGKQIILNCTIKESDYLWPFCNVTFQFYSQDETGIGNGIIFNDYEYIAIKARYAQTTDIGFRLQLRSFDSAYAEKNSFESWKFMGIEYWPGLNDEIKVPLNTLQVPNWWRMQNKVSLEHSAPDFNNIMVLELATGTGIPVGNYRVHIDEIRLVGKYLSNEATYGFIVFALVVFVAYMIAKSLVDRARLKEKLLTLVETNKSLHKENINLNEIANVDELTKTLNRRACFDVFNCEFDQLCVVFMDIDYFKTINDTWGHDTGDVILKQFAQLINANIRDRDFFIRWGGEEFLLISPDFNLTEAQDVANKLRNLLSESNWPNNIKLTCSFGVAQMGKGERPETVISRADKALYRAKVNGRNRVELAASINF